MGKETGIFHQHPEFIKDLLGFRVSESASGHPVVTLPYDRMTQFLRNGPYLMRNIENRSLLMDNKVPVDRAFLTYLLEKNHAPVGDPSQHYIVEKVDYTFGEESGSVDLYMISADKLKFLMNCLYARIGAREIQDSATQLSQTRIEMENLKNYMTTMSEDFKNFTASPAYISYDRAVLLNLLGQAVANGRLVKESGMTEITTILTLIIMDSTDQSNQNGYAKYSRSKYHTSDSGVSKGTYDNKMKWLVEENLLQPHPVSSNQYKVRVDILRSFAS